MPAFLPLLLPILASPPAQAESLVAIRDPRYASRPVPDQAQPIAPAIRQLVYPTLGLPALVRPGERFSALAQPACELSEAGLQAWLSPVGIAAPADIPLAIEGLQQDEPAPGLVRIALRAPVDLGADHYHLHMRKGSCLDDSQPSAVRIYRERTRQRLAVLADQQLGDPTAHLEGGTANGTLYPGAGHEDPQSFRAQLQQELEFLDPLLVLYTGDLVFGMDYVAEYGQLRSELSQARLAIFAVPGNHDAYANHSASLGEGAPRRLLSLALCGRRFLSAEPLDGLTAAGSCALQQLAGAANYRLEYDGLEGFRRSLGPENYVFEVGNTRFIGFNSYGGSAARRMAVPVSLGRLRDWRLPELLAPPQLDPTLGAPLVDNFGGWIDRATRDWIAAQVRDARQAGRSVALLSHHDPTGVYRQELAVVPNEPFGSNPMGLGVFEVWNYDRDWDSDPQDDVGKERAQEHGGQRLMQLLAGQGTTWFCGHAHRDAMRVMPLGPISNEAGPPALLRVVQTTTGGAGLSDEQAQRGYRMVEFEGGELGDVDFVPDLGWSSLPAGNFWIERSVEETGAQTVVNGLPLPIEGRLRFTLPASQTGYRFLADGQPLPLADLTQLGDRLVAYVQVQAPAARNAQPVARNAQQLGRIVVEPSVHVTNLPPKVEIMEVGERQRRRQRSLRLRVGKTLHVSAAGSSDEEGLLRTVWRLDGRQAEGMEARFTLHERGRTRIELRVWDMHGAMAETSRVVKVRRKWWPWG